MQSTADATQNTAVAFQITSEMNKGRRNCVVPLTAMFVCLFVCLSVFFVKILPIFNSL